VAKAELRCSHLCRKKDGAPFPYVKLFFLVWQMALFLILRRCFYLHVLHGLRENKVFEGLRYARAERQVLRVCCMTLLFLLFGEGSAVFTFREINMLTLFNWYK
jgi:hypothetical protein